MAKAKIAKMSKCYNKCEFFIKIHIYLVFVTKKLLLKKKNKKKFDTSSLF